MRRNHLHTNNILLDLTPLLDVIFIILLIFVSQTILSKKLSGGSPEVYRRSMPRRKRNMISEMK